VIHPKQFSKDRQASYRDFFLHYSIRF